MGKIRTFFFDTYAIIEIIFGNPNYDNYTNDVAIVTGKLNLMDLHYILFLKYGKEKADKCYDEFVKFAINVDDKLIKQANEFRASLKKRGLSYVDCIGYTFAKSAGIKFLTGDKEFENFENVEFVK